MSGSWADHIARVNGYIAADREQKAQRRADVATTRAQQQAAFAPAPAVPSFFDGGGAGGANDTATGAAASGGGARWGGGFPNATTLASNLDISPLAARAGITALGLLGGPAVGMGLGALGMIGNIANTANNHGMLSGLGVNPGFGSTVGGLLGFNGLAGSYTDALNAAMAGRYDGFSNLSPAQADGFNFGGWADIAAQMDAANAAAMGAQAASNPSGGWGDRGDISAETLF